MYKDSVVIFDEGALSVATVGAKKFMRRAHTMERYDFRTYFQFKLAISEHWRLLQNFKATVLGYDGLTAFFNTINPFHKIS